MMAGRSTLSMTNQSTSAQQTVRSSTRGVMRALSTPVVILLLCSVACDSESSKSTPSDTTAKTPSETTQNDEGAAKAEPVFGKGIIRGTVVLEGDPPAKKTIGMRGDRFCQKHDKEHVAPKLEVGKDGGLPHCFVYIKKGIKAKYPAPEEAVVLDQSGCMYEPHIFGLQVGQTLKIKNSDNTAHNVNSLTKRNQKFNISQPQAGMVSEKSFQREEVMVKFKCDVHGWMEAYCGVLRHPFFAVTDADGNFSIENVPAGEYTIEVWHEMYGARTMEVPGLGEEESREVVVKVGKRG